MIYFELFYVFFFIGLFTFGGGYAMIPLIESETINRGWLTEETFYNMIAISESTPGPIAVNMATFIGNQNAGFFGALLSTIGVVLPSFIIIYLIARIFTKLTDNIIVKNILNGFKGVVVGLILATALTFLYSNSVIDLKSFSIDIISIIIFMIVVITSFVYKKIKKKNLSPYLILIFSGLLGLLLYYFQSL